MTVLDVSYPSTSFGFGSGLAPLIGRKHNIYSIEWIYLEVTDCIPEINDFYAVRCMDDELPRPFNAIYSAAPASTALAPISAAAGILGVVPSSSAEGLA